MTAAWFIVCNVAFVWTIMIPLINYFRNALQIPLALLTIATIVTCTPEPHAHQSQSLQSPTPRLTLRQEHFGPTVGHLKRLERLGRGREHFCSVCSAVSETFRAAWTLSDPIQHVKYEEVGCRKSKPLDSLFGGVLANQRGVWEGRNTVYALVFYTLRSIICRFHVLEYWHETSCYYVRSEEINLCSFGNALLHV